MQVRIFMPLGRQSIAPSAAGRAATHAPRASGSTSNEEPDLPPAAAAVPPVSASAVPRIEASAQSGCGEACGAAEPATLSEAAVSVTLRAGTAAGEDASGASQASQTPSDSSAPSLRSSRSSSAAELLPLTPQGPAWALKTLSASPPPAAAHRRPSRSRLGRASVSRAESADARAPQPPLAAVVDRLTRGSLNPLRHLHRVVSGGAAPPAAAQAGDSRDADSDGEAAGAAGGSADGDALLGGELLVTVVDAHVSAGRSEARVRVVRMVADATCMRVHATRHERQLSLLPRLSWHACLQCHRIHQTPFSPPRNSGCGSSTCCRSDK